MRTLKFRVWDTKGKKFLEGIPFKEYMLDEDCWDHHDMDNDDGFRFSPQYLHETFDGRLVWDQFIGRKDDKGTDIYTGDILLITTNEEHYTEDNLLPKWRQVSRRVKTYFDEDNLCFWVEYLDWFMTSAGPNTGKPVRGFLSKYDKVEIVGNIYENTPV